VSPESRSGDEATRHDEVVVDLARRVPRVSCRSAPCPLRVTLSASSAAALGCLTSPTT